MNRVDLMQFDSDHSLAAKAAEEWLEQLGRRTVPAVPYTVAFSGGRIAKIFFTEVAQRASAQKLSLQNVHFFWADERCVAPSDPESNYSVAQGLLFSVLGIPAGNIHRIPGELPPATGVRVAEEDLMRLFPDGSGKTPSLDLIFLGMGEDGHVASLFPGDSFEEAHPAPLFRPVVASKPPPHRITMTYRMLQAAKEVWVLASGEGKKEALASSLFSSDLPLGKVRASRPSLRLFSDIHS